MKGQITFPLTFTRQMAARWLWENGKFHSHYNGLRLVQREPGTRQWVADEQPVIDAIVEIPTSTCPHT